MNDKLGRNDPCACGSGKKYKQCCLPKKAPGGKRKLTAKWINQPSGPNLIERTFGANIDATKGEKPPVPTSLNFMVKKQEKSENESETSSESK